MHFSTVYFGAYCIRNGSQYLKAYENKNADGILSGLDLANDVNIYN
jgi:hypothetical protein